MKLLLVAMAMLLGLSGNVNAADWRHHHGGFQNNYSGRYQSPIRNNSIIFNNYGQGAIITDLGQGAYYFTPLNAQPRYYPAPPVIDYGVPGHRWIRSGWND